MNTTDDDDDFGLFRKAMAGVARQAPPNRLDPDRPLPRPRPLQREADDRAVLLESLNEPEPEDYEAGDTLAYRMPGVQDGVFRKLKRGSFRVEAELDLHGMNVATAREAFNQFLADCQDFDRRCVRIVHGKGLRSAHRGPVLKGKVDLWLRRRKDVLAFASARPQDGGTGAVVVLLRRVKA